MTPEESMQILVCDYIKTQYKNTIFFSDSSGLRLPIGLAKKAKAMRGSRGIPDLFIAEPAKSNEGIYLGLFIELKKECPFKKDGSLKSQIKDETIKGLTFKYDHLKEQSDIIDRLNKKGYLACFSWSVEMTINIIDEYMKRKLN